MNISLLTIARKIFAFSTASFFAVSLHAQSGFTDDFDRENSTDLGPNWTEVVGDWEILEDVLHANLTDLTTGKVLIHEPIVIDRAFSIEADIDWPTLRNQWNGLIWNYDAANSNYYLLRMRADNGNVQLVKFVNDQIASVLVNLSGAAAPVVEGRFHRIAIRGDGRGTFWWTVSLDDEVLGSGEAIDEDPLPDGPSGLYASRESMTIDRFQVETFDLVAEIPELKIEAAVEIHFDTTAGNFYQIQSSPDLLEWVPEGDLIRGDGNTFHKLFSTREQNRKFFRVLTSTDEN